jgi:hypothetical protein
MNNKEYCLDRLTKILTLYSDSGETYKRAENFIRLYPLDPLTVFGNESGVEIHYDLNIDEYHISIKICIDSDLDEMILSRYTKESFPLITNFEHCGELDLRFIDIFISNLTRV